MDKIKMITPLVEMDGDEMTRVLWKLIKEELILPFIELKTEYYDLGLTHRNETNDKVTMESALATKKYGVAVKCATITPNAARMTEYNLTEMWKSPNGTIRAALDGTVFRKPIQVKGIQPVVKNWKYPITLARHAYGDIYKNTEMKVEKPGKAYLLYIDEEGNETKELIHEFTGAGILQGVHNTRKSIESFAKACFNYALDTKQDLWFSSKDTISKKYDHTFKDIFQEIFEQQYAEQFAKCGIKYFYTLIDDAVARVMKAEGGFIWACKNYDGDVMSDMVSSACGSLAMMTSVLAFSETSCTDAGVTVSAPLSITDNYYTYLSFKIEGYDLEKGSEPGVETINVTEYEQAPWVSGVKLKDGTLLKTLYGGPGTSGFVDDTSNTYVIGYAFDRVINVDEVDSILFAKEPIYDIGAATEKDYYLVPLK